jgi:hypothetical protein
VATDVDIANRALSRLGAARIATVNDDTKNARAVRSALEIVRAEVLADHPWNCATRRAKVYAASYAVTAAAWVGASSRYRVTIGNHALRVGDPISITGVASPPELNDGFTVGAVSGTTIDLVDPDTGLFVNGAAYAAWTSGGVVLLGGLYDHRFQYVVPEDCLRVLEIDRQRDTEWAVESGRIATDLGSPLNVLYIWNNDDTESYQPLLVSAFAARLASELALEVVDSPAKRQLADQDYAALLAKAKRADAKERTPAELDESPWITARISS